MAILYIRNYIQFITCTQYTSEWLHGLLIMIRVHARVREAGILLYFMKIQIIERVLI